MSFATLELPGVTVAALCDAVGPFFRRREEAFPDATAEAWAAADERDPDAVDPDGRWLLHFHCYAIRFEAGPTVLVDAGIGPADAPAKSWAPVPGQLPEQLQLAGIAPADVDIVILTHLHTDHVGWAVGGLLPNARHVLQRADADAVTALNPDLASRLVEPLRAAGRLQLVEGRTRIASGLEVVHTPGHTPGHQVAMLIAGGATVAITGDLILHAIQLVDPALGYLFDGDPDAARTARRELLDALPAGARLATSHPTQPFHTIS
jgi:glyoxylase-like metal-dependent hydrolase (beta-lactamase superfamily II)